MDRGTDLFMYKAPVAPSSQVYTIRPYRSTDESAVYKVCLMTFKDGLSAVEEFSDFPKLAGDMYVFIFENFFANMFVCKILSLPDKLEDI